MQKAIMYRKNPHFVFRNGFCTGYRSAATIKLHLNLAVRKVYFLHLLKVAYSDEADSHSDLIAMVIPG